MNLCLKNSLGEECACVFELRILRINQFNCGNHKHSTHAQRSAVRKLVSDLRKKLFAFFALQRKTKLEPLVGMERGCVGMTLTSVLVFVSMLIY